MSETKKRQQYTAEFKHDAVQLVTERGYKISEAARRLGINPNLITRWKHELTGEGADAFRGHGRRTEEAEELHCLREENRKLRLEREILKKATAFFANQHK